MKQKKISTYSTDDFILDDDFRKIVLGPDASKKIDELLDAYPGKKQDIALAAKIVRTLQVEGFHQEIERKRELWQQIIDKQRKTIRLTWLRYAASFLLLICLGSAAFYWANRMSTVETLTVADTPHSDAVLILSDGEKITISSRESKLQYSTDGTEVLVSDSAESRRKVSGMGNNQLIVPYGRSSFVTLSEGTKVWLNAGSRLVFPSRFTGDVREVSLEGEAYFEVASVNDQPFIVKTNAFQMRVYGTAFNVRAYDQDNEYNVVLVEGKVGMSTNTRRFTNEIFLAPYQKASLNKENKQLEVSNLENVEMYTAWMDGYLIFSDSEISNVLNRIARHYNIVIESRLPDNFERIYGKLDLKNDVDRVLNGIAFITQTKYEKTGDTYVFTENK